MAWSSQVFACGTISQAILTPTSASPVLIQNQGPGTVILGGSTPAGPQPAGFQMSPNTIQQVPVRNFGGAATADDALYARATAGGTAQVAVLQPS